MGRAENCQGSPPRVRGAERPLKRRTDAALDHPRVCGEQAHRPDNGYFLAGSPPRVRGAVLLVDMRE